MSLLSGFYIQCHKTPDNTALVEGNRQLNYQQVLQQTNIIAGYLSKKQPHRVAIAIDRGIDATLAVLACLQIGACYIPLDLKNPDKRLNFIVDDANVQCIIGKGHCPDWVESSELWLDSEQCSNQIAYSTAQIEPESLAAILYTSGSTGLPKGVALSHRAMLNFSQWANETFNIQNNDHIASLAPFHFDLSVFDLFSSLNSGATVYFVPAMLSMSPSRLTAWLSDHKITIWYTVPSLLSFITLKGALSTTPLPYLKSILFAGEVFPTHQLIKLGELLPQVNFFNLYGPTETNVCCYWPVNKDQLTVDRPIPIGIPACGSTLTITPESGELRVKSANNLSGYWQQGHLVPALSKDNDYATGDKVSINDQGEYCYHGRLDRLLKCSGYRVEPAEIEQIIQQRPEVEHCAVIGIKDETSGQRPVAIVVIKSGCSLTDIVNPIKQSLPIYMQPCKFIVQDSLPYLANGKIDYQQLQQQREKQ